MARQVTAVLVVAVLIVLTACASAAPAPTATPQPTPTPAWVPVTKPEHLAGLWVSSGPQGSKTYWRFTMDGTLGWQYSLFLDSTEGPTPQWRFWFEDGVYYQECSACAPVGSYRAYVKIDGGRAVALRFEVVDDSDPSCEARSWRKSFTHSRLD